MNDTVRVIVADDDPLVRAFVVERLTHSRRIRVVAECADGTRLIEAARKFRPDVVICDVWMPSINGVDATAILQRLLPNTRIILMTRGLDARTIEAGRRAGAQYVIDKAVALSDLLHLVLDRPSNEELPIGEGLLSSRERHIASLIMAGRTNADIAHVLGLSINSVKTYASRIYAKLQVSNRVQLTNALRGIPPETDMSDPST